MLVSALSDIYCDIVAMTSRIRWFNFGVLAVTPALGIYGILTTSFCLKTAILSVGYYIFSMLGAHNFSPYLSLPLRTVPQVSPPGTTGYIRTARTRLLFQCSYSCYLQARPPYRVRRCGGRAVIARTIGTPTRRSIRTTRIAGFYTRILGGWC